MNAAIITTLNEAATIGELVDTLRREGYCVYVVDDQSTDATRERAAQAGAHVLLDANGTRQGIAPCLCHGWQRALADGATTLLQIDAGGSHDPAQARRLTARLDEADLVVGSRFCRGAAYLGGTTRRRWLSRTAAVVCSATQGAWVSDWSSGYRALTAQAARQLLVPRYYARMHGWQLEVLAHAHALGLRVVEEPIVYRAGRSSFSVGVANEAFRVWLDIMHHIPPKAKAVNVSGQKVM